jgi:glycolate oxidase iron-sulfur subunit
MRDYGHLLRDEPSYAARAAYVAARVRDPAESLSATHVEALCSGQTRDRELRFQAPCSLQHGLRGARQVIALLEAAGFRVAQPRDAHLCCGSAGTYSILQPAIAGTLRARKLDALDELGPHSIVTANIGCQLFLQQATEIPVRHWLEVLADALSTRSSRA